MEKEIRKFLKEKYGIETDAQVREELAKISLNLSFFVEALK